VTGITHWRIVQQSIMQQSIMQKEVKAITPNKPMLRILSMPCFYHNICGGADLRTHQQSIGRRCDFLSS